MSVIVHKCSSMGMSNAESVTKNGEAVCSSVGHSRKVKGLLQHVHIRMRTWEKWLKGDAVLFIGVCFLETYSVLWENIGINRNFACELKVLYVTPFVCLHARFLSCKPLEKYEISSLHHLCLEIWNYLLFSVVFLYLKLLHTHQRRCHGDKETSECPLWARGALKLTLGQHIYCKWKEKI